MDADVIQGPIVADAGYGSEPNYEFIEDKFGVLITLFHIIRC